MPRFHNKLFGVLVLAGRGLRMSGAAPLVYFSLVLLTAFGVAATPRFVNAASDDALRTATQEALPINRNLSFETALRLPLAPGVGVVASVRDAGEQLRAELPSSLLEVIAEERFVVDSPLFEVWSLPDDGAPAAYRFFRFRLQDGIAEHLTVLEGSLPRPLEPVALDEADGPVATPAYQTAITADTAELLQIGTGDRVLLLPKVDDALNRGVPLSQLDYQLMLEISGIFVISDPGDEFWFGDRRLHRALTVENPATPDSFLIFGMGLLAEQDYGRLMADTRPSRWNYGWRYFVDADRLDSGSIDRLTGELGEMELRYRTSSSAAEGSVELRSGLGRIADGYRAQRRLAVSMLSLILTGLAGLASAVALLLAALRADRSKSLSALVRSRGASVVQLSAAHLVQAVVLFLPAALLGYGLALSLVEGRDGNLSVLSTVAVAVAASFVSLALALPTFSATNRPAQIPRMNDGPGSRRLVLEGLVLTGAIVGLVLLRRRGLVAGDAAGLASGVDLFLAAVPVLLGLAFGIVLMRLYPSLVSLAARVGSRTPGVVGFVGVRRINSQPPSARLPLLVMLVAVGVAVFGSVLVHSITEGQQDSAWQRVGADYRIESLRDGAPVSRLVDLSAVGSVVSTADAAILTARLSGLDFVRSPIPLVAIDAADYQAVARGTRADPSFPAAILTDESWGGSGIASKPIPSLVSSTWPGDSVPAVGEVLLLNVGRENVMIEVQEVRDGFPGLDAGSPFVVVARSSLGVAGPTLDLRATRRYVRAPDGALAELRENVRTQSPGTLLVSRVELLDELVQAPMVRSVEKSHRMAVAVAAVLAVIAALAGLALTAKGRARDISYLRTAGLAPHQVVSLTIIEQVPPAILATGGGVMLGLTLAWLTHPGLDLSPFAGAAAGLRVDWWSVLAIGAGLLGGVLGATWLYSYLTRRVNLGNVLRLGDRL
jgi:putative ABC transport system permease protein